MHPKKVDGPGPGSHKLPGSVQIKHRHAASVNRTTFGTSSRAFDNLPKDTPAPNRYRPAQFTEASHGYTFAIAPLTDENKAQKQAMLPGPQNYNNMKEMKNQMYLAKSMLGSGDGGMGIDNGFPGPDRYMMNNVGSVPGFRIVQPNNAAKRNDVDIKKMEKMRDVGPLSYDPFNPAL